MVAHVVIRDESEIKTCVFHCFDYAEIWRYSVSQVRSTPTRFTHYYRIKLNE